MPVINSSLSNSYNISFFFLNMKEINYENFRINADPAAFVNTRPFFIIFEIVHKRNVFVYDDISEVIFIDKITIIYKSILYIVYFIIYTLIFLLISFVKSSGLASVYTSKPYHSNIPPLSNEVYTLFPIRFCN